VGGYRFVSCLPFTCRHLPACRVPFPATWCHHAGWVPGRVPPFPAWVHHQECRVLPPAGPALQITAVPPPATCLPLPPFWVPCLPALRLRYRVALPAILPGHHHLPLGAPPLPLAWVISFWSISFILPFSFIHHSDYHRSPLPVPVLPFTILPFILFVHRRSSILPAWEAWVEQVVFLIVHSGGFPVSTCLHTCHSPGLYWVVQSGISCSFYAVRYLD